MKTKILKLILIFVLLATPLVALARLGVGVNVGTIRIEEALKAGGIYKLPPFSVIDSGDEIATYHVSVTFFEKQPERRPDPTWFTFTPNDFELKPGQSQEIQTRLIIPFKAFSGDYFAFLEASPTKKQGQGQVSIGIAAAAKLYFKVQAGSVLGAARERVVSYWQNYGKKTLVVLVILAILAAAGYVSKNYQLKIFKKK